ncbi:GlcG/HbpS family heme-binding protein [Neisseria yangbaofengii]|uniref:GlcG/HbpS family heme-binding protein n=1 Tax=Neisseria yangbaofengii TaxID=2709396 RepID=UPI0013EADBCF|nr:heme-binding protein [Neisseria yangbaofengii]
MEKITHSAHINLATAHKLIQFGMEYAEHKHLHLAIAIVDAGGHLLAFARMDEAALISIDTAVNKAKTAVYLKAPSKQLADFSGQTAPRIFPADKLTARQGGMPLLHQGRMVGAVGVSGADGESDNRTAEMIAAAFAG